LLLVVAVAVASASATVGMWSLGEWASFAIVQAFGEDRPDPSLHPLGMTGLLAAIALALGAVGIVVLVRPTPARLGVASALAALGSCGLALLHVAGPLCTTGLRTALPCTVDGFGRLTLSVVPLSAGLLACAALLLGLGAVRRWRAPRTVRSRPRDGSQRD
jgi:hypothetical protein